MIDEEHNEIGKVNPQDEKFEGYVKYDTQGGYRVDDVTSPDVEQPNDLPDNTQENNSEEQMQASSTMPNEPVISNLRNNLQQPIRNIEKLSIVLPNAQVGQQYCHSLDLDSRYEVVGVSGLDKTGLVFNEATKNIIGVPNEASEVELLWDVNILTGGMDALRIEHKSTLLIIADPKSLWKNIPTDSNIIFYKNDCESEFVDRPREGGKRMVAASQRGRSHAHVGKPRDDHFKLFYNPNTDWYVIAVADGAGSADYSREGAKIACDTVVEQCDLLIQQHIDAIPELARRFKEDSSDANWGALGRVVYGVIAPSVYQAYQNILTKSKETVGSKPRDFSTTLLVSIAKKYDFGWFIASFWVGDGGLGLYRADRQHVKLLGEPDGGEYAGQTRFLTMPEIVQPEELQKRLRVEVVEDFTALMLMTDGVTDPMFKTDANLLNVGKWDEFWKDLNEKVDIENDKDLLQWLDFWSPGEHDDRTIAILF